ncbi:MAG: CHAD domain-containing protein [Sulfuricurvum sp.]|nr:CHAD domain-containing protein [Sulfuricurvum sp.]
MKLLPLTRYISYHIYHTILLIPKITLDSDPSNLHQFRVSLRRIRALLKLYPYVSLSFPPILKQFIKRTNPLRELDVLLADISSKNYPNAYRHITELRNDYYGELFDDLRRKEILEVLNEFYDSVIDCNPSTDTQQLIYDALSYYQESTNLYNALTPQTPEKELHALRIRFKISRYALEFLTESSLHDEGEKITQCKMLQDHLGRIQDISNQIEWFQALYRRHPIKEFSKLLKERKKQLKIFKESSR